MDGMAVTGALDISDTTVALIYVNGNTDFDSWKNMSSLKLDCGLSEQWCLRG